MDVLTAIHPWLGYAVLAALVAAAVLAFNHARASRQFDARLPVAAMVLLDVQVLLGAVVYVGTAAWRAGWVTAYVHPLLALAALGAGHAAISRGRGLQMVDDAWRAVARGLTWAGVLVVVAIGLASAV